VNILGDAVAFGLEFLLELEFAEAASPAAPGEVARTRPERVRAAEAAAAIRNQGFSQIWASIFTRSEAPGSVQPPLGVPATTLKR